jgi:type II secretory pathway component PulJ
MMGLFCHSEQREESPSKPFYGDPSFHSGRRLLYQHGFSLIELMISTILGIFLLFGLVQIYLSAKKTYIAQQNITHIQENGRYAIYFLNKEIRMAGYAACEHTHPTTQGNFIYGRISYAVPGSDIIEIQSCGNLNGEKILKKSFYIADTKKKNAAGNIIYGLYEKRTASSDGDTEEIVNDVSRIEVQYGIADAEQHAIANYKNTALMTAQDWPKVRSVEIELIIGGKPWNTYIALREPSSAE